MAWGNLLPSMAYLKKPPAKFGLSLISNILASFPLSVAEGYMVSVNLPIAVNLQTLLPKEPTGIWTPLRAAEIFHLRYFLVKGFHEEVFPSSKRFSTKELIFLNTSFQIEV